MEETSVLIVGAGPTGLALAATLGRMGINVLSQPVCHSLANRTVGHNPRKGARP
jgi:flavin-dependent dehydrogenase